MMIQKMVVVCTDELSCWTVGVELWKHVGGTIDEGQSLSIMGHVRNSIGKVYI